MFKNLITFMDRIIFFFDEGDEEYWQGAQAEGIILNNFQQQILYKEREKSIKELIPRLIEREQRYSGLLLTAKQARVIAEKEFERAKREGYVDACNRLFLEKVA